ncbi:hypothetical protein J6X73_01760 [Candidatus Saccharibacteria bacterium]|nr:hypothetical protein [Candidatus Saccharibacteria bacterium]
MRIAHGVSSPLIIEEAESAEPIVGLLAVGCQGDFYEAVFLPLVPPATLCLLSYFFS